VDKASHHWSKSTAAFLGNREITVNKYQHCITTQLISISVLTIVECDWFTDVGLVKIL